MFLPWRQFLRQTPGSPGPIDEYAVDNLPSPIYRSRSLLTPDIGIPFPSCWVGSESIRLLYRFHLRLRILSWISSLKMTLMGEQRSAGKYSHCYMFRGADISAAPMIPQSYCNCWNDMRWSSRWDICRKEGLSGWWRWKIWALDIGKRCWWIQRRGVYGGGYVGIRAGAQGNSWGGVGEVSIQSWWI